jgi:hypothetical protein
MYTIIDDLSNQDCSQSKNALGEQLTPPLESPKLSNLTQETDNALMDLMKDFKAGGDPRRRSQGSWMCKSHDDDVLLILYKNIWSVR